MSLDFSRYDARHYETLPVVAGYSQWSRTYEGGVVQDEMDIRLLERLASVAWPRVARAVDLACGTGRIGAWLRRRGVSPLDGVDLTPEMLGRAREKGIYDRLLEGDVRATGLAAASYDLAVMTLADEHLPALPPLYAEAARLLAPGGAFVLVGYHPYFMLAGIPTHFDREGGAPAAIETHVHLTSDHVSAGLALTGLEVEEMKAKVEEGRISEYRVTMNVTFVLEG